MINQLQSERKHRVDVYFGVFGKEFNVLILSYFLVIKNCLVNIDMLQPNHWTNLYTVYLFENSFTGYRAHLI